MTDREAFNEFARGFAFCIVVVGGLLLVSGIFVSQDTPPKGVESPRFEVVDHYKGCDLLRWSDSQLATYKYVLYCGETGKTR